MSFQSRRGNMEKCIFCGWTRKTAYPSIRFFGLPREPGMKRIQWLYVLGNREIQPKDRVCSVHFRSGRPSSDPSHEDFVPHLYLNNEPPPEVLRYLESLAETKLERAAAYDTPHPDQQREMDVPPDDQSPYSDIPSDMIPARPVLPPKTRPSILQRRRKVPANRDAPPASSAAPGDSTKEEMISPPPTPIIFSAPIDSTDDADSPKPTKRIKLQVLGKPLVQAAGLTPGQMIIIRKRTIRKSSPSVPPASEPSF